MENEKVQHDREAISRCRAYLERLEIDQGEEGRRAIWREISREAKAASDLFGPSRYSLGTGTTVTIPGDPYAQLSPNLRLHYRERAKRVAAWRERARLAWLQGERTEYKEKVRLEILVRRARTVDPDNLLAACKGLVDGLVSRPGQPGLLRGDTAKDVEYAPVRMETGKEWKGRECLIIYCRPIGSEKEETNREFWQ